VGEEAAEEFVAGDEERGGGRIWSLFILELYTYLRSIQLLSPLFQISLQEPWLVTQSRGTSHVCFSSRSRSDPLIVRVTTVYWLRKRFKNSDLWCTVPTSVLESQYAWQHVAGPSISRRGLFRAFQSNPGEYPVISQDFSEAKVFKYWAGLK